MIKSFALVGLGGAMGSILRFGISKWMASYHFISPVATFSINIAGCFLMGLFVGMAEKHQWMQGNWLLLLTTGFCGGFTTFSAFAFENVSLLQKQLFSTALIYSLLSVILGILACKAGFSWVR
ncbi:MAG TPA: fluoride efflux transporter CrcB [Flavipsychrobacter sp.]|nr:fluoride efflux transporter CrcB [Flavipsychrobacter sp.]